VPAGVLQPVVRRRRARRRRAARLVVAVALLLAAAGASYALFAHAAHRQTPRAAVQKPKPQAVRAFRPHTNPVQPVRPPSTLLAPAVSEAPFSPPIAARAAIVVDAKTGRVLWAYRSHRRLPIASTTKIMTAIVALRALRLGSIVEVDPRATRVPLVKEGLRPHERVRAWKLFDGLLLFSGNDDALALAVAAEGSRGGFINRMNEVARELGLADTHFSSPSGVIDAGNYSTAWDLATLTRYALRDARFRRIVRQRIAHVPWAAPTYQKVYVNKNTLLGRYPGADGVKTGWTTLAGHCLVASATRRGWTVIAVILNGGNVYRDGRRLLDRGFSTRA
jgi:serine-type D-Ala-D-Ala carboxypeptidase (penicillin-binding protein 5/6)